MSVKPLVRAGDFHYKIYFLVAVLGAILWLDTAAASMRDSFQRIDPHQASGSGHSVANSCRVVAGKPGGWPKARATLKVKQSNGNTRLTIKVRKAMPNAIYTVWLRVKGVLEYGPDSGNEAYGGSPLRPGAGSTPLAATDALDGLIAITPAAKLIGGPLEGLGDDGSGSAEIDLIANGFRTDSKGNASREWALDFPFIDGAYPFQKYRSEYLRWDMPPLAIAGAPAPFTLRVATHCSDGRAHGLDPNKREGWFQWVYTDMDW